MPSRRRTPEQNRAIYLRRQERSQAIYGRGYGAKGGARQRRVLNQILPADVTARPRPLEVTAGGAKVTKTAGRGAQGHLAAAMEAAAANNQRVSIRVTFDTPAGPRTRILDRNVTAAFDALDSGPGSADPPAHAASRGDPMGAIQVTAGTAGFNPATFLQWLQDFYDGDYWDALHDLYDYLYE